MRFFTTAAKGTEPALRDELREIGLKHVRADRGGVHFEGELIDAARACLWTRVGVRVLLHLACFEAPDATALYTGAREIDWTAWVTPRTTVAVRASCRSSRLTHSQFIAQKTKDAIVDTVRDRLGSRPSVDRDNPDVLVAVHVSRDRATLYLDASGASLHERGWRARAGPAPLRETLAAAVVRLSGWDGKRPLIDPMCGGGTIAIEAAAWAAGVAPGLWRRQFGLERWASHDDLLRGGMRKLRDEARAAQLGPDACPPVFAYDADPRAVELTRANAQAAGVDLVVLRQDVRRLSPVAPPAARPQGAAASRTPGADRSDPPGVVATNPPYGVRLEAEAGVFEDLAYGLRRMQGYAAAILAASPAVARALGRAPDRFWVLYNGPIECRLLLYESAETRGTK